MEKLNGILIMTAINEEGKTHSESLRVLGGSQDEEGFGTLQVEDEKGNVYYIVEQREAPGA